MLGPRRARAGAGRGVLELVEDRESRIDYGRSYFGDHDPGYPLLYADQDVLNAVLASRLDAERVVALDHRLAPMTPFEGVEVVDERRLRCAYADGTEPYLLHPPCRRSRGSARRPRARIRGCCAERSRADVEIALPAAEVPRRLGTGALGRAEAGPVPANDFAGSFPEGPGDERRGGLYCVADSRYFPGAVGLVNSLRLVGHREPILVLDTGLTDARACSSHRPRSSPARATRRRGC